MKFFSYIKNRRKAIAAIFIASSLTISVSAIGLGTGTVTADALNVRSGPSTSHDILDLIYNGKTVTALEETDGWYKITYDDNKEGYVSGDYLSVEPSSEDTAEGTVPTTGYIKGTYVRFRTGPSTSHDILSVFQYGANVEILGQEDNGWYKVSYNDTVGYVCGDYVAIYENTSEGDTALGQQIVDYAKRFLGTPYVYGGTSPSGFDCSGLVYYVYQQFGYSLNRCADDQYYYNGVKVDKANLQVGDLVFFSSYSYPVGHVGIYIGNGQFIHSSSGSCYCVTISDLSSSYYTARYVGACRII